MTQYLTHSLTDRIFGLTIQAEVTTTFKQLEACTRCGEDTSVGSAFFSDRFVAHKRGATAYLCSPCAAAARGNREVHSDEERERDRERLERAAFAYGVVAKGGH